MGILEAYQWIDDHPPLWIYYQPFGHGTHTHVYIYIWFGIF